MRQRIEVITRFMNLDKEILRRPGKGDEQRIDQVTRKFLYKKNLKIEGVTC